ncbi:MAG: hypothetical protein GXP31_14920 [Kiritimatiellaeota bacterium]|nr:hypothetical protein [Kiritimatiellota bacterium]
MRRLLRGVGLAAALLLAMESFGGVADLLRYNGVQLEYYDSYTSEWLPARVNPTTGEVEFQSGGSWWPAVNPATGEPFTSNDLSGLSASCPVQAFRQETNRGQATRFMQDSGAEYRSWRETFKGMKIEDIILTLESMSALEGMSKDTPPADVPEWQTQWGFSTTYREDDFDIGAGGPIAAKTRTRSQTLSLVAVHDRFALLGSLTYDRIDPDSGFGDTAYDRLSLRLTPVYAVLEQTADGFDLDLIGSLGASHSWYEDDMGVNDPSHVFAAGGLGLGRIFRFGALRVSYLYGVSKNTSGDVEVTGKSTIPMHSAGATYTVPLAKRWLLSLGMDWVHTSDLPAIYDSDEYSGRVRVAYVGERWGVSLLTTRSINNGNQRQWSATGQVICRW